MRSARWESSVQVFKLAEDPPHQEFPEFSFWEFNDTSGRITRRSEKAGFCSARGSDVHWTSLERVATMPPSPMNDVSPRDNDSHVDTSFTEKASEGQISPAEMTAAIEASGYLLEGRIARVMAERGLFVQPNCFYPDPSESGRSIEIDVVGQYFEWVNETNQDAVSASLLVECKNNAQPFAFFMQTPQIGGLIDTRIHYGGFPSFSTDSETHVRIPLHHLLEIKDWHHYFKEAEVATQFYGFLCAPTRRRSGKPNR